VFAQFVYIYNKVDIESRLALNFSKQCLFSEHLNTGQVRFSNGRFVSGCRMVWLSNGIRKPDKFVRFFEWSAILLPFQNRQIRLVFKWFQLA
jgi:hypothetical protein